ncbi:MAG: HU family DNA-binding protein [Planctomycetales bacterium]|nr:HU family DNA-binding protein [Planctomycetales bacterium]
MAKKKAKSAPAQKPMSKSEILASLSESTGLSKKEVASVFDGLSGLIGKNLSKRGPGVFTIPGLSKFKVVRKPATKARKGINPFTKEETIFKAKPARNVVKILPLKALKDMV